MVNEKDFDDIRMDQRMYEKAHTIHYNWYLHSIKAIMGSLGKDLMRKLHRSMVSNGIATNYYIQDDKLEFYKCLDRIPDRRDVVTAAQCLMKAKDTYEEKRPIERFVR